MSYKLTRHCELRMQQRGRRIHEIEFLLEHGTETDDGIILSKKDAAEIERRARKVIELAQRLSGVSLPISEGAIKTVFMATPRQARWALHKA